jgi:polyhydroxybutyrate depolymerase
MDEVADTANFIVVYPAGVGLEWNNGFGYYSSADDVGFISALIDTMEQNFSIDTSRVYATGGSAGGFMCYRLACEIPHRFAAIASVAGLMGNSVRINCQSFCPMPVLHIHGTADPSVLYNGSLGYVSVDSTMKIWIAKNNCPTTPVITNIPDTNAADSSSVIKFTYGPGTFGSEVILYKVNNGSHSYPGGDTIVNIPNTNMDMIATIEIWNFFRKFTRQCFTAGIDEQSTPISGISVYPNPANDLLILETSEGATLEMFNLQGQSLIKIETKAGKEQIDISKLPEGMYILNVITGTGSLVKKFIKENEQ